MLRKKGIVRKTFLFSSLLIALVVMLSFSVLYFIMPGYYLRQKERNLQNNLNALTSELKAAGTQEECVSLISGFVNENNADAMAFSGDGQLLPKMSSPFVSMQDGGGGNGFYTIFQEADDGSGNRQAALTFKVESFGAATDNQAGGAKIQVRGFRKADQAISLRSEVGTDMIGYVAVSGTLQPVDEAKGVILSLIPYVLLGAVALGLLLSWVYARQITKPILEISETAVKMREMSPDALSLVRSDDELGQLSQNLNELYAKLLENIGTLRDEMARVNLLERSKTEMMQSASHELKTPVTALAGMLDGMIDNVGAYKNRDKYLPECKTEVEKLSRLVREILEASRADQPAGEPQTEETAADILLEQALEEYSAAIAKKRLRLSKDISPLTISTDPEILRRALANIVSNAARYTPDGGQVCVALSDGRLSIENECEAIPDGELEKLFEPFYTRDSSRDKTQSGTGLGLYIVKRSMERLHIPYDLSNTETGIKITLTLL